MREGRMRRGARLRAGEDIMLPMLQIGAAAKNNGGCSSDQERPNPAPGIFWTA